MVQGFETVVLLQSGTFVPQHQTSQAQIGVRLGEAGLEVDRLLVGCHRFGKAIELGVSQAQTEVRLGEVGLETDRLLEGFYRFGKATQLYIQKPGNEIILS